jgi:hypothetical protein
MLAQIVDKESFLLVYDCIVDRSSAQIDSGHGMPKGEHCSRSFRWLPGPAGAGKIYSNCWIGCIP